MSVIYVQNITNSYGWESPRAIQLLWLNLHIMLSSHLPGSRWSDSYHEFLVWNSIPSFAGDDSDWDSGTQGVYTGSTSLSILPILFPQPKTGDAVCPVGEIICVYLWDESLISHFTHTFHKKILASLKKEIWRAAVTLMLPFLSTRYKNIFQGSLTIGQK